MDESRIVAIQSAEGPVYFEASLRSDLGEGVGAEGLPSMDDLWKQIRGFAEGAADVVNTLKPNSMTIEVGAEVAGETAGIMVWVIGKAKGNASVGITLEWTLKSDADGQTV